MFKTRKLMPEASRAFGLRLRAADSADEAAGTGSRSGSSGFRPLRSAAMELRERATRLSPAQPLHDPALPASAREPADFMQPRRIVNDADMPRAIAIPARAMAIAGDTCAGLLLSQLLYWTRRGTQTADHEGWIFKTAFEWERELGMTWKVQHRARKLLLDRGLIEERRLSMPARLEYRVGVGALGDLLIPGSTLDLGELTLPGLLSLDAEVMERLFGRAFLFHSVLTRLWPVPTAMMCSRLVAGVRLNLFTLMGSGAEPAVGTTRLIRLHRQAWQAETGLTRDQWQTARRNLLGAGVLVERKHNFPRRVDLGIDLAALATALRAGRRLGAGQAGLDRAKQVGGIGRRPNQPTESPDPANSDRPIQPLSVTRFHLYPVLDEERQPQQHPTREPRADGQLGLSFGSWGWGWGEKGYGSQKTAFGNAPASTDAGSAAAAQGHPTAAVGLARLAWPSIFTVEDQGHAGRHLAGLDLATQQLILDEIEWQHRSGKAVRSPVALTRALARKVQSGQFAPDGAHRVATARKTAAEEASRQEAAAAERAARAAGKAESPIPAQPKGARAALDAVRERLAGRRRA